MRNKFLFSFLIAVSFVEVGLASSLRLSAPLSSEEEGRRRVVIDLLGYAGFEPSHENLAMAMRLRELDIGVSQGSMDVLTQLLSMTVGGENSSDQTKVYELETISQKVITDAIAQDREGNFNPTIKKVENKKDRIKRELRKIRIKQSLALKRGAMALFQRAEESNTKTDIDSCFKVLFAFKTVTCDESDSLVDQGEVQVDQGEVQDFLLRYKGGDQQTLEAIALLANKGMLGQKNFQEPAGEYIEAAKYFIASYRKKYTRGLNIVLDGHVEKNVLDWYVNRSSAYQEIFDRATVTSVQWGRDVHECFLEETPLGPPTQIVVKFDDYTEIHENYEEVRPPSGLAFLMLSNSKVKDGRDSDLVSMLESFEDVEVSLENYRRLAWLKRYKMTVSRDNFDVLNRILLIPMSAVNLYPRYELPDMNKKTFKEACSILDSNNELAKIARLKELGIVINSKSLSALTQLLEMRKNNFPIRTFLSRGPDRVETVSKECVQAAMTFNRLFSSKNRSISPFNLLITMILIESGKPGSSKFPIGAQLTEECFQVFIDAYSFLPKPRRSYLTADDLIKRVNIKLEYELVDYSPDLEEKIFLYQYNGKSPRIPIALLQKHGYQLKTLTDLEKQIAPYTVGNIFVKEALDKSPTFGEAKAYLAENVDRQAIESRVNIEEKKQR